MSSLIKSIFSKNFINLSLNQGVNIVATLIYTPFLFQNLGDENFGLIHLALSAIIILTILVSYGYNLNGPIKIAQSKNVNEENLVIIDILNLRLSVSLIVLILSIPFIFFFTDQIFQQILHRIFLKWTKELLLILRLTKKLGSRLLMIQKLNISKLTLHRIKNS